jgi:sialate O-acetylesterase
MTTDVRRRLAVTRTLVAVMLAPTLVLSTRPAGAQRDSTMAGLRAARIFADGMMVQRDAAIPVWGWAASRTSVTVSLAGMTRAATADQAGAWRVTFPAKPAGGPYAMSITGAGGGRIDIRDILVGDIWVASGQSNMEWSVSVSNNAAAEIASARDSSIREFAIPHSYSDTPESDVVGGRWAPADPQHVGSFSAVAYFFARELRKSVDVPIGIIHTSWGGANIETWMSRRALGMSDSAWQDVVARGKAYTDSVREALRAKLGALPMVDSGLVNGQAMWADPALPDDAWRTIQTPGLWEAAGYDAMDGVGWYRTSFTLTPDEARQPVRLSLGPIDDSDITWVNGVEVGRTEQRYAEPRLYTIPASALKAGPNVIAVRVDDTGGGGGIYGSPSALFVDVAGVRRPLAGAWRFRVGAVSFQPDGQRINKVPTILYNRMLHPLLDVPIKGVLWYQGESNANNMQQATDYRTLFAGLITSWRREWRGTNGRSFPFLWVQLPNFGHVDSVPPPTAGWATLRESQAAALALPNTGQVVAIDLGGAEELHPRNKQDVGARLALKAREVAYGQRVVSSGPTYRRHTVRDGRVVIELGNLGRGLVSRTTGDAITGFAIAGSDRRFVWASARIEGDRVVVWSDRVTAPVAVRYLWTNSPTTPVLYNRDGLPAAPFRTDDW